MSNNKIGKAPLREAEKTLERKLEIHRGMMLEIFSSSDGSVTDVEERFRQAERLEQELNTLTTDLRSIKTYLLFDSSSVEVDDKWVDRFGKYL